MQSQRENPPSDINSIFFFREFPLQIHIILFLYFSCQTCFKHLSFAKSRQSTLCSQSVKNTSIQFCKVAAPAVSRQSQFSKFEHQFPLLADNPFVHPCLTQKHCINRSCTICRQKDGEAEISQEAFKVEQIGKRVSLSSLLDALIQTREIFTEFVHRELAGQRYPQGITMAFWDMQEIGVISQKVFSPVSLRGQTKIDTGGQVETSQV